MWPAVDRAAPQVQAAVLAETRHWEAGTKAIRGRDALLTAAGSVTLSRWDPDQPRNKMAAFCSFLTRK